MDDCKRSLVEQAKLGRQEAFEQLFLMEKEYLYKMAFLYMKNQADAMDLVQECILQCILSIKSLKEPDYFRTWMTRIMINCARQEWKRRDRFSDSDFQEEWQAESEKENDVSHEERMDLYHAIDLLDFPYRAIIIQRYFAGERLEDIAKALDMPLNTVKVYHGRARKKLKALLEG